MNFGEMAQPIGCPTAGLRQHFQRHALVGQIRAERCDDRLHADNRHHGSVQQPRGDADCDRHADDGDRV